MDFFHVAMILWIMIAVTCIVLGLVLTLARRHQQKRRSTSGQLPWRAPGGDAFFPIVSPCSSPRICLMCGQQTDDDEADFCWSCGTPLARAARKARSPTGTTTILVNEQALEREIQKRKIQMISASHPQGRSGQGSQRYAD